MAENDEKVFEGEVENVEQSLAKIERGSDLVLGTQAAHESLMMRAKGLEALRNATIRALIPEDFHEFGKDGKGYWLESTGVSKVSSIYGVDYTKPIYKKEWKDWYDEENDRILEKHYYVIKAEIEATFRFDNRKYTATGSASTRDTFFMRDGKIPHPLNVDEEDVQKKAETNARARCLMGLGIANFTKAEIVGAGMDTSKVTGHDFKSAPPKGEPTEKQWELLDKLLAQKVDGFDSKKLIEWAHNPAQKITGKKASLLIEWLLTFKDGAVDYEEQFTVEYDNVIAGKYHKEDKK